MPLQSCPVEDCFPGVVVAVLGSEVLETVSELVGAVDSRGKIEVEVAVGSKLSEPEAEFGVVATVANVLLIKMFWLAR